MKRNEVKSESSPGHRERLFTVASALGVFFLAAFVWDTLGWLNLVPRQYFPSAQRIAREWLTLLGHGYLWAQVAETSLAWIIGLAISLVVGVALGVVCGTSDAAHRFMRAVIELVRPIPPVVFIPVLLLILGVSRMMSIVLIVQGSVWPILIQTMYGLRSIDPVTLDVARSYRLTRWSRFYRLRLPASLPFIATGFRLASSIALIVAITSELVGGAPGLGTSILLAEAGGDMLRMYGLVVTAGLLGLAINVILRSGERRVLPWSPRFRVVSA